MELNRYALDLPGVGASQRALGAGVGGDDQPKVNVLTSPYQEPKPTAASRFGLSVGVDPAMARRYRHFSQYLEGGKVWTVGIPHDGKSISIETPGAPPIHIPLDAHKGWGPLSRIEGKVPKSVAFAANLLHSQARRQTSTAGNQQGDVHLG